nr:CoA-transferase [Cohnella abietis]
MGAIRHNRKRKHKTFNGRTYLLEKGIVANFTLVKASKADTHGNLVFRRTRNTFLSSDIKQLTILIEHDPNEVRINRGLFYCWTMFLSFSSPR